MSTTGLPSLKTGPDSRFESPSIEIARAVSWPSPQMKAPSAPLLSTLNFGPTLPASRSPAPPSGCLSGGGNDDQFRSSASPCPTSATSLTAHFSSPAYATAPLCMLSPRRARAWFWSDDHERLGKDLTDTLVSQRSLGVATSLVRPTNSLSQSLKLKGPREARQHMIRADQEWFLRQRSIQTKKNRTKLRRTIRRATPQSKFEFAGSFVSDLSTDYSTRSPPARGPEF